MSVNTSTAIVSLVYHLANKYHTLIANVSSGNIRQHNNCIEVDASSYNNGDEYNDGMDDNLQDMKNEITVLLCKSSRKQRLHSTNTTSGNKKKDIKVKCNLRRLYFTHPVTGGRQPFAFEYSIWYMNYVTDPQLHEKKRNRKFRLRFWMPYHAFIDLEKECKTSSLFAAWSSKKGYYFYNKSKLIPLKLIILCALQHLGRGLTFNNLEEYSGINTEPLVLVFTGSFSLVAHIYTTSMLYSTKLLDCESEYLSAGFLKCVGSIDASRVITEKCSSRLRQSHLRYKLAHTARTYNITVNHQCKILHTTPGHSARFNDKTLVLYVHFVNQLHDGKYNDSHKFTLLDFSPNGEIIHTKCKGCFHLNWSVTVPPLKQPRCWFEIRFPQWLESLKTDVECAFGILKCRWRVLKRRIRLCGIKNCDII